MTTDQIIILILIGFICILSIYREVCSRRNERDLLNRLSAKNYLEYTEIELLKKAREKKDTKKQTDLENYETVNNLGKII